MVRSSRRVRRGLAIMGPATAVLLGIGACGTPEPPAADVPTGAFTSAVDLAPMLPPSADVVGVAVAPEGQRYVLDRNSGLYEIGAAGARQVFSTSDTTYGINLLVGELTDVVALGAERFALTAVNDGYMLDLHNKTLASYFCYLPALPDPNGGDPGGGSVVPPSVSQTLRSQGIAVKERTESVAFSPDNLLLYAQPQTIRVDTGEVMGSELFVFSDGGGQPIQVWGMPSPSFIAGGMVAVDRGSRLMLGSRNELYAMDPGTGPTRSRQFDPSIDISGLALDTNGDLLVLDRAGLRLLTTTLY
jgi:hypothetical protein